MGTEKFRTHFLTGCSVNTFPSIFATFLIYILYTKKEVAKLSFKAKVRTFSLRAAGCLALGLAIYLCCQILASFFSFHLTSRYVLAAKMTDGKATAYTFRTKGLTDYLGMTADFLFGGDFTSVQSLARVFSANFAEDDESPSHIEDMPLVENISQPAVNKTVSAKGGALSVGEDVTINNETSYSLDLKALNAPAPAFKIKKTDDPLVLIVHSHATESYAPTENYTFFHSSEDRCINPDYNMVRIGKELAGELEKRGIGCVHITDLFDYPEYNNSYARSCKGVLAALEKNPSIKIVLDLHRDSIVTKEGVKTKLTTTIDGKSVAQLMLVVGTDELGLAHEDWQTNLKFAVDFQKCLLKEEKNFARPINLRTSRFNGHTCPGAVIVEVGTGGNTIEEALASAKYISSAVKRLVDQYT